MSLLDDGVRTGVVAGDEIVDLTDSAVGLPGDMVALLALGPEAVEAMSKASATSARRLPIASAHLRSLTL